MCTVQDHMADNYLQGLLLGNKNNVALRGHDIKELLVSSEIECALHCVRLPECSSINVQREDAARGLLFCQLNNATADAGPDNLVGANGFNYYSVFSRHFGE